MQEAMEETYDASEDGDVYIRGVMCRRTLRRIAAASMGSLSC